ncbi:hypothetical protein [uncultured Dubosiella sp.]|uniref:hypothetical protein n=1 Tax=uncultured Dubosiella sp. TaxID=1937011 RepID=UPI0027319E41|nr:hypothetical protein [uncultured Dubosiella sp.]
MERDIMGDKVYIENKEEGKHLYRNPEVENRVYGTRGYDDTNTVADGGDFWEYEADEWVEERLKGQNKVAVDIDEYQRLQSRSEEDENEDQVDLGDIVIKGLSIIGVATVVALATKYGPKCANYIKSIWKSKREKSNTELVQLEKKDVDQIELILLKDLKSTFYHYLQNKENQDSQKAFREAIIYLENFSKDLNQQQKESLQYKLKDLGLSEDEFMQAVHVCFQNEKMQLENFIPETMKLEDKSLIQQIQEKQKEQAK